MAVEVKRMREALVEADAAREEAEAKAAAAEARLGVEVSKVPRDSPTPAHPPMRTRAVDVERLPHDPLY